MTVDIKGMANLLRDGVTMLSRSCPECGTPLFRLKSKEIVCKNCKRRVVIVPEGEEATAEAEMHLNSLEKAIVEKLVTLGQSMSYESDFKALRSLSELMDSLLGNLEKIRASRKA